MKVLIVGFAKIKYMPYLNLYLENLNREKNEIHLVYWNRDEQAEDVSSFEGINLHEFKCYQEDEVPKKSKIKNFFRFKKYVKVLLKEKFDFMIVMQTVTAILFFDVLMSKRFKGKYVFDYRDFTYENMKPYKWLVKQVVNNSKVTFVSSRGFKKYLPDSEKIRYVHNIVSADLKFAESYSREKIKSDKIRLGFWGFLREAEVNLEIIKKISEDTRFELHYYGREQKTVDILKEYVFQNQIKNVFFHGEYNPKDKYDFLKNTDIIHNIYCEDEMLLAMSNKYYDSVVFQVPQLVSRGSYMAQNIAEKGLGAVVDPFSETFTEEVYNYFTNINFCDFESNCIMEKKRILEEMSRLSEELQ